MPPDAPTFSLDQANAAQLKLRGLLGLGPERFPMPAFIGMLSDEIEQLRAAGQPDEAIARHMAEATGAPVTADDLARHYALPEDRGRG